MLAGNAVLTPERRAGFEAGAITVMLPGDRIEAIWTAGFDGGEAQFIELIAPDGTWFLTGRARVVRDEKMGADSEDEKHASQVAIGPDLGGEARGKALLAIKLGTALMFGAELVRTPAEPPITVGDEENDRRIQELLERAMSRTTESFRISVTRVPMGEVRS